MSLDEVRALPQMQFMQWQVYFGRIAQRKQLATQQANEAAKRR